MRLWKYIVLRLAHTIITLVIVLVLLFVVFRLMPGDPTRFFIRPGQTDQDREDLLVSFGFYKRVPVPGNGYTASFRTGENGTYEVQVDVTDSAGRNAAFYTAYSRPPFTGPSPRLLVEALTAEPWAVFAGDRIDFAIRYENVPADETFVSTVTISSRGISQSQTDVGNARTFGWNAGPEGAYSVRVDSTGNVSGTLTGYAGIAVNHRDTAPFQLVEEKLVAGSLLPIGQRAQVTINVTSASATISLVRAQVRTPSDTLDLTLSHPLVAVENSVLEEFWTYMTNMLQFDFGKSRYTSLPVKDEIAARVGPSLLLFGSATIIAYALGVLLGAVLAWRRGSKMELSSIVVSLVFYSMPVFWLGLILLWAFAFQRAWFPLGGFADIEAYEAGGATFYANVLWHMALPLLNLVMLSLAGTILLMRNSMLEVMGEDYITTAKAKGLSERRVMYRHAARNAMLPVVTSFALSISTVIGGGVLTERIFSWPGMGAYLVEQTIAQDFPAVQGAFYLLAILTILANLVADFLYAFLDPRVRL